MSKILKCADNDDSVAIKAQDDNPDTVTFIFKSKKQEKISTYEMRLMALDQERLEISNCDFSCEIRLLSTEFARICRDLSQFGEFITISCTNEGVSFSITGDTGSGSVRLIPKSSEESISIAMNEPITLSFACKYFNSFTKATSLSAQVKLCMSIDTPLALEYEILNLGHIRYYLAPKIEVDEC